MTEVQCAWVAGILEGEGYFHQQSDGRKRPGIVVNSTDEDIVRRLKELTDAGNVFPVKKGKEYHKDVFRWAVMKAEDAARIMEEVLPHMGERRSQRINDILAAYRER